MKILFITAHLYLPQMYGGLQRSTHQLCKSLVKKGHWVSLLCALTPDGWTGFTSRIKMQINQYLHSHKVARDTGFGYPIWRTWHPRELVEYVAAQEKPDLIVVLAAEPVRMALAAKPAGIPLLMQLQDVEFKKHGGDFGLLGKIPCVANSNFTAGRYREAYGVDPVVITPFVNLDDYKTPTTRENVLFINPVPEKGRDIAVEIARLCPEIPFTFVESWPLSPEQRKTLMDKISGQPNVTFLPPQKDMRTLYGKAKIVLIPSLWEEAYGRVATEAQISGIPVIASSRGGLPEAVGDGGILLSPEEPVENWAAKLRKLWNDDVLYSDLSLKALAHAERPEMSYAYHIEAWEKLIETVTRRG